MDNTLTETDAPSTSSVWTTSPPPPANGISVGSKRGKPMSTVICQSYSTRGSTGVERVHPQGQRLDDAPARLDTDDALCGQSTVANKSHKAARAVAALLDLAAVGVENPIAEIDVGTVGIFHEQNLIAAHAEAAVSQTLQLRSAQVDPLRDAVKHDEIVAQALHLGEFKSHAGSAALYWRRSGRQRNISATRKRQ